jgi:hypothetical protein
MRTVRHVFDVSAGLFVRGLANLKTMLTKAEAHAAASGSGDAALIDAQLAADMNSLGVQVHWATEGAKLAIARLLGLAAAVPSENDAKSFADLKQRIDTAITYLSALAPHDLEAGLERVIEMQHRGASKQFSGSQFLLEFAIPSFFFHMTTAYGILRHKGVELTKGDFLGSWG